MAATAEEERQESWTRPRERFHVLVSPNELKQELASFHIYLLILLTGMLSHTHKKNSVLWPEFLTATPPDLFWVECDHPRSGGGGSAGRPGPWRGA